MTDRDYEGYGRPDEDIEVEEFDFVHVPKAMDELTLRDLFALAAMHARVPNGMMFKKDIAEECYALADEMIKRRR